jgi:hypothetical protein
MIAQVIMVFSQVEVAMNKLIRLLSLLIILPCLGACNLFAVPSRTQAWIDAPRDGLQIPEGQNVIIQGHASGIGGIERIECWVNEQLMFTQEHPSTVGSLARLEYAWSPPTSGTYIVQIIAYGSDGSVSQPDTIMLHIGKNAPMASTPLSVTPSPEISEAPPTATITPTSTISTITPPPDTSAPAPPVPISPTGKSILACTGVVNLSWSAASDPSGIDQYSVELQRHSGDEKWSSAPGSPISGIAGTSTNAAVDCGWYYQWRVRARDGAGNWSSFSSWALFAVTLP